MINAECQLVPIPAADYVQKNPPVNSVRQFPVYYVGSAEQTKKAAYKRAYDQIVKLYVD